MLAGSGWNILIPLASSQQNLCDIYLLLSLNFIVTPCINNIQHFDFQLMHTRLKNVELLKNFKISKTAPTCFGLQGNHHQGATLRLIEYTLTQCTIHMPHRVSPISYHISPNCFNNLHFSYLHTPYISFLLQSQYAAITLTTSCMSSTHPLLTKCVILAKY